LFASLHHHVFPVPTLFFIYPCWQPMIKELIRIGAQFIGYREYASKTEGNDSLLILVHNFLLLLCRNFDYF
jgi:hypothetical protein